MVHGPAGIRRPYLYTRLLPYYCRRLLVPYTRPFTLLLPEAIRRVYAPFGLEAKRSDLKTGNAPFGLEAKRRKRGVKEEKRRN